MRQVQHIMGMPITVELVDASAKTETFESVFNYLRHIDETFSTYKPTSSISQINAGKLAPPDAPAEVRAVLAECARC